MGDRLTRSTRLLSAYYYAFEPTGDDLIDDMLEAVAMAGKGAHHTEAWGEHGYDEAIQLAANKAAKERRAADLSSEEVEALRTAYSIVDRILRSEAAEHFGDDYVTRLTAALSTLARLTKETL
jgi:hypothetical protein